MDPGMVSKFLPVDPQKQLKGNLLHSLWLIIGNCETTPAELNIGEPNCNESSLSW